MCAAETFETYSTARITSSAQNLRSLRPFPPALSIRLFDVLTQKRDYFRAGLRGELE